MVAARVRRTAAGAAPDVDLVGFAGLAERHCASAASVTITFEGERWFLSVSNQDGRAEPDEAGIAERLRHLDATELASRTAGADRGVAVPLYPAEP